MPSNRFLKSCGPGRRGISTIFVSSELEELLEVCHRILVMRQGGIVKEVNPDSITTNELYEICMKGNQT